jgi:hypothetical protein
MYKASKTIDLFWDRNKGKKKTKKKKKWKMGREGKSWGEVPEKHDS